MNDYPMSRNVSVPCEAIRVSPRERLSRQENALVSKLEEVRSAMAALDANPGVEDVLEKLSKVGF